MNPNALQAKAQRCGWRVITERDASGPMITLVRDEWELWVAFSGTAPEAATIRMPGRGEHQRIPLREIGQWVRGDRHQMSRFAIGDRVTVVGRSGIVTDITLALIHHAGRPGAIRLRIDYDHGGVGTPFSDQVHRPHAELHR
ncbi:hypothetical protein [Nonomuraea sediminis]|uniref:hypothetical protein n=1 Tax=Nonomuraea sediminis TaxID=2835864 RepID=UPI001BDCBB64|nr:hypothetical protein [Nonomuraea sediminis]